MKATRLVGMSGGMWRRMLAAALIGAVVLVTGGCGYLDTSSEPNDITFQAEPIGSFMLSSGVDRQYFLVAKTLSPEKFTELAEAVHETNPEAQMWFMDDSSQMPTVLKALPEAEKGNLAGFPTAWVDEHTVAHSAVRDIDGTRTWVLFKGSGTDTELLSRPM